MSKILLIADCGNFKDNSNGVYAKNIQLYNRLSELYPSFKHVNTNGWKRNPFVLLNVLFSLIQYKNKAVLVSLNTQSAYKFFSLASIISPQTNFIYFVIGGVLGTYIQNLGVKHRNNYRCVKWFLVESLQMKQQLEKLGFANAIHLPNFKKITYIPSLNSKSSQEIRFVFISRIIPEKGCDLIFEAVDYLNSLHKNINLHVDFYGKIDSAYQDAFTEKINSINNVSYKGYIDLSQRKNYDVLCKYHVMLFPTYWKGEGFPGVLIDAFISGLPVIASDWAYNRDIITHKETGLIIPPKNVDSLADAMMYCIHQKEELGIMSKKCQMKAMDFNTNNVLTPELLHSLICNERRS